MMSTMSTLSGENKAVLKAKNARVYFYIKFKFLRCVGGIFYFNVILILFQKYIIDFYNCLTPVFNLEENYHLLTRIECLLLLLGGYYYYIS